MKTAFALSILALGGKLTADTTHTALTDVDLAYGAPATEAANPTLEHRNHRLVGRMTFNCTGTGKDKACWNAYTTDDITTKCRSTCSSSLAMVNCLTTAGHVNRLGWVGAPRIDGVGFPYLGTTNASELNNASLVCFKDGICPRLDQYMTCFQCGVDNSNMSKSDNDYWVEYLNKDLPGIDSLCKTLGTSTANYTSIVVNGAMTATVGSVLLAFGVAVASFL